MVKFKINKIILFLIILLAAFFRFYGNDWDQGQHLHPDERFLTMVLTSMKIPKSFGDYLNPAVSTMSPYNVGYGFFVYGTFPLNLTKILGVLTHNDNYYNIHLLGRMLSALFDIGVVYLVYLISRLLLTSSTRPTSHNPPPTSTPLLAAFLYSIMVLPIQLSHFFAVDSFLNFFLFLSFYFLITLISNLQYPISILLGLSFGTALACKISAVLFLPIIGLGFFFYLLKSKKIIPFVVFAMSFGLCAYGAFRLNQPQAFKNNNFLNLLPSPQFVENLKSLKDSADPNGWYPPAIQWIGTKPIIYPLKNMVLWGLGFPLGIISLMAIVFSLVLLIQNFFKKAKTKPDNQVFYCLLIIFWTFLLFIYQGVQVGKVSRYFLPIYPFLALLSAQFLSDILRNLKRKFSNFFNILHLTFYILLLIYPLSFMSIYTKPITRVTASQWIYDNIPSGSVLSYEHWDDALPLPINGKNNSFYQFEELALFAPDTEEKWKILNRQLAKVEYLILSSNRLWGSIGRLSQKYPISSKFYQDLFAEKLNFRKIAEFTSYPCFPPIGQPLFCFPDQSADESFTVYDHPKVLIYQQKNKN